MEYREITLSELRERVQKSNQGLEANWLKKDGWYTSVREMENFDQGHVTLPINNGPVVEFKTKWGKRLTGIITSWDLSKSYRGTELTLSVRATRGHDVSGTFYLDNYGGLSRRSFKIIDGEIPAKPVMSDFILNILNR